MPKMTAKYRGALYTHTYRTLPDGNAINQNNQEELYQFLQEKGFFWNSKLKKWEEHDIDDADEPTILVMVRVWANADIVEEAADEVVNKTKNAFELVERSKVYPCRPPKQREGRIYLKFLPRR